MGNARWLTPGIGILVILFFASGSRFSWTAKLFDDLPMNHSARQSTDLVSSKLGGVASVDFVVGSEGAADPWKSPENIERLKSLAQSWRQKSQVGSVLTLADFLATGKDKVSLPDKREGIAELELLYSKAGESPVFPMNKLFGLFRLASTAAGLLGDLVWLPAMLKRFPWLLLENLGEGLDRIKPKWNSLSRIGPYGVLFALGIVAFHSVYASL